MTVTPTEVAEQIPGFEGTVLELVDLVAGNYPGYGTITVDKGGTVDSPTTVYRFVTGGWSECEEMLGALSLTMFHALYWRESHRGGLVVYEVPDSQLDWHLLALDSPEFRDARRLRAAEAVCAGAGHAESCRRVDEHLVAVDAVLSVYGL